MGTIDRKGGEADRDARREPAAVPSAPRRALAPAGPIELLGNRATLHLLRSGRLQRKPRLSEPGDPLERQADRAAEAVQRQPLDGSPPVATTQPAVTGARTPVGERDEFAVFVEGRGVAHGQTSSGGVFRHPSRWEAATRTLTIQVYYGPWGGFWAAPKLQAVANSLGITIALYPFQKWAPTGAPDDVEGYTPGPPIVAFPGKEVPPQPPPKTVPQPPKVQPPKHPPPKAAPPPTGVPPGIEPKPQAEEPHEAQPAVQPPESTLGRVKQLLDRDPAAAAKLAPQMTDAEFESLAAADRTALLWALALNPTGDVLDIAAIKRLLEKTPDAQVSAIQDQLSAYNGLLLRAMAEYAKGDSAKQLVDAVTHLWTRSQPGDAAAHDKPAWMESPLLLHQVQPLAPDPTSVRWVGKPPEWAKDLKYWTDARGNTRMWTPELGLATWDRDGKRLGLKPPDTDKIERALTAMSYLQATGGRRFVEGKGWLDEGAWQEHIASRMKALGGEAKVKLENLESGTRLWEETQTGFAYLASVPSHLLGGRWLDEPGKLVKSAHQDVQIALREMERAQTSDELTEAERHVQSATTRGEHGFSLYKEDVYSGAERTIVGIKGAAVVATAYVSAPVLATYGGGALTLKLIGGGVAVGTVGGGVLSAARQGTQLWEGSRKDFSFGEVGEGAIMGGVMGGTLVVVPQAAPLLMGLGVASSADELAQGHYATGAFDLGTAMLPFAIKGAPQFGRWARPRIAAGMMRMGAGVAEVPGLGGNTYTPNIPMATMVLEVGGRPMGGLPRGGLAPPQVGIATPELLPLRIAGPKAAAPGGGGVWQTAPPLGAALPGYQIPYMVRFGAPSMKAQPPADPYDVAAWNAYYAQNPEVGRSVGAASVDDPNVASQVPIITVSGRPVELVSSVKRPQLSPPSERDVQQLINELPSIAQEPKIAQVDLPRQVGNTWLSFGPQAQGVGVVLGGSFQAGRAPMLESQRARLPEVVSRRGQRVREATVQFSSLLRSAMLSKGLDPVEVQVGVAQLPDGTLWPVVSTNNLATQKLVVELLKDPKNMFRSAVSAKPSGRGESTTDMAMKLLRAREQMEHRLKQGSEDLHDVAAALEVTRKMLSGEAIVVMNPHGRHAEQNIAAHLHARDYAIIDIGGTKIRCAACTAELGPGSLLGGKAVSGRFFVKQAEQGKLLTVVRDINTGKLVVVTSEIDEPPPSSRPGR
jgi:hypothetical protein